MGRISRKVVQDSFAWIIFHARMRKSCRTRKKVWNSWIKVCQSSWNEFWWKLRNWNDLKFLIFCIQVSIFFFCIEFYRLFLAETLILNSVSARCNFCGEFHTRHNSKDTFLSRFRRVRLRGLREGGGLKKQDQFTFMVKL